MSYRKLFLTIFVFSFAIGAFSQESVFARQRDFSLGAGYLQTMNSYNLPYGMEGINLSLSYSYIKKSNKNANNFWGFAFDAQNAFLQREVPQWMQRTYPHFNHAELRTGGVWLRHIPLKIKDLNVFAGAALSLNLVGDYAYTKSGDFLYTYPYINWYISPDFHFRANYKLPKMQLQLAVNLPVVFVGYFNNQFHEIYLTGEYAEMAQRIFTPNTLTFFYRYFKPNVAVAALFPFYNCNGKTRWNFKLEYRFASTDLNLKCLQERAEQHDLRIGLVYIFE
ncbi:MAG: hypothetical protein LBN23_04715 [Paludibacter sp.]|jgi:hypothetical protein|nr:hypothetical protein [Paludibacter sp.]